MESDPLLTMDTINQNTCFVVPPIGEPRNKTRIRSDKILRHSIIPIGEEGNLNADKTDEIISPPGLF